MIQRCRRSLTLSALLLAMALAACTHADLLAPTAVTNGTYDAVHVSPSSAELSTAAPANTVALTAFPYDSSGKRLYVAANAIHISYSSSAPGTAGVSGDGIVTAVA